TRMLLGNLVLLRGQIDEAGDYLARSLGDLNGLPVDALPRSKRAIVEGIRGALRYLEIALCMGQALALSKDGDARGAETAYRRALEALPTLTGGPPPSPALRESVTRMEAAARNGLAWLLVATPGRSPEQVREAVAEAERAVALVPDEGDSWNILALARYRAGDWKGAGSASERSMRLRGGGNAYDWLTVAMSRWQQGEKQEAHEWFARAIAWAQTSAAQDPEIQRLASEAAGLLGEPGLLGVGPSPTPSAELPSDPFAR